MKCVKCNAELPEGAKFCGVCGTKVEGVNTQQAQPQQNVQQQAQPQQNVQQQAQPQQNVQQQVPPQQQWQNANGAQQFNGGYQAYPQQPKKPVNTKMIALIGGIAAAALIIIIIAVVAISNRKETICLEDYVTVTCSGYDGYGTAYISFDYDTYYSDLLSKSSVKVSSSADSIYDLSSYLSSSDYTLFYTTYSATGYDVDTTSDLSNGDVVTITFNYDEETAKQIGIKFKGESMEYEVSELSPVVEIDPFADVTVSFTGISPNVYAEVVNNSTDEFLSDLYFDIDTYSNISVGDTVTVSVYMYEDEDYYAEYYGYKFTQTSKEFTCESVDYYAASISDVDDDVLGQMKSQTEDVIEAYFATESEDITASDITYVGYYFLSYKGTSSYSDQNQIYIVYSASVSSTDDSFETSTIYLPVRYTDLIVYADGTCYVDLTDYYGIIGSTSLEYGWWTHVDGYDTLALLKNDLVTSQKSDYNVESDGDVE